MKRIAGFFSFIILTAVVAAAYVGFMTVSAIVFGWIDQVNWLSTVLDAADLGINAVLAGLVVFGGMEIAVRGSEAVCRSSAIRARYRITALLLIAALVLLGIKLFPVYQQSAAALKAAYRDLKPLRRTVLSYWGGISDAWAQRPFLFRVWWSCLMCGVGILRVLNPAAFSDD